MEYIDDFENQIPVTLFLGQHVKEKEGARIKEGGRKEGGKRGGRPLRQNKDPKITWSMVAKGTVPTGTLDPPHLCYGQVCSTHGLLLLEAS